MLFSLKLERRVDGDPGAENRKVINLPEKGSSALRRRKKVLQKEAAAATGCSLAGYPHFVILQCSWNI